MCQVKSIAVEYLLDYSAIGLIQVQDWIAAHHQPHHSSLGPFSPIFRHSPIQLLRIVSSIVIASFTSEHRKAPSLAQHNWILLYS